MRSEGILYARCGELELRLEASPAPTSPVSPDLPSDPADAERRDLEDLLYSSGAEAGPFLRAMQKGRVA